MNSISDRWVRGLVGVLALVLSGQALLAAAPATQPQQQSVESFDRWYAVLIEDQPVGWMHETVGPQGRNILTQERLSIALARGPITIQIGMDSRFLETPEGRPVECASKQSLGIMDVNQAMRFTDAGIELTSEQGGRKQTQVLPNPPEQWLPPAAAQRYVEQQMKQGAKEIRFHTMTAELGARVIEMQLRVLGPEKTDVMGKVVPALAWEAINSASPSVVQKAYVDESGRTLKAAMELMPGMTLTIVEADEDLAKAKVNPPELVASTLVKPDKPIPQPRQLRSAVYELRLSSRAPASAPSSAIPADGPSGGNGLSLDLPQTGVQRVQRSPGSQSIRVTVDLDAPPPQEQAQPGPEYLQRSLSLDSQDPQVRALVQQALKDAPAKLPDADRAERLRQFAHGFIKQKDLSVGMATASEVARTGEGDCTEHAVLLAAMLRAAGIPSRTAAGLIYVDSFLGQAGVFGYHMWAQAWLGGRWVDQDATLPAETPFDAAHIALQVSAMNDPSMANDLVKMAPLIGRVQVRVVELGAGVQR